MENDFHWCIIILAFNEERTLQETVHQTKNALSQITNFFTVLVIDDGSTDDTGAIADALARDHACFRVIHHEENRGIGESMKTGLTNSVGDIVGFIPGDLQFNPSDLIKIAPYFDKYDFVSVYRNNRQDFTFKRKLITIIDKALVRILFNLKFKDLHWTKFLKRSILSKIRFSSRSPSLDTELLYKAKKLGVKIVEIPLQDNPRNFGQPKGGSLKNVINSFLDLLKLRLNFMKI